MLFRRSSDTAVTVAVWRSARQLTELAHKIFVISIAALERDRGYAYIGRKQEIFCHRYAAHYQVLMKADAEKAVCPGFCR